jgi:hypothetical protein
MKIGSGQFLCEKCETRQHGWQKCKTAQKIERVISFKRRVLDPGTLFLVQWQIVLDPVW